MGIQLRLTGQDKDLGGGFTVRRLLPSARRQSVGPFVFFDHFGPVTVTPGSGHDVRPHPHMGLATVTYLFEGVIRHRDSLGCVQDIEPGAINWMTAGRGIVHSERRPEALHGQTYVNHGLQLWAALPLEQEEAAPSFVHTPASAIPRVLQDNAQVRVLVGQAFGVASPVQAMAGAVYLDLELGVGASLVLPPLAQELAVYAVQGDLSVDGKPLAPRTLALLAAGEPVHLQASAASRLMVLGGQALEARRLIWWNFVSSRKARIVQAAQDWQDQRMGQVPGETDFIPLPERNPLNG
jgi:redox-sensitive bicupin YhaK (pirin superfamily)